MSVFEFDKGGNLDERYIYIYISFLE